MVLATVFRTTNLRIDAIDKGIEAQANQEHRGYLTAERRSCPNPADLHNDGKLNEN